jgi:hypothetical protein
MKIRALLAGIALATGLAATAGIAHAGAWTASLNGEGSCEPAPRTATDTWVVTWGYTNTEDSPDHAFITGESDQHSGDQQLIGHELASGQGGFLVVSYPASAASDTLSVTFTWKNAKGHVDDHKTVTATVHQPKGCDVYVPPTVPEPGWTQQVCDVDHGGIATPASYTTTAVAGVHYDVTDDAGAHSNVPAGTHTVPFLNQQDTTVYVQAWDDTQGGLIHQWTHVFSYATCPKPVTSTPPPPPSSSSSNVPPPVTSSSHTPVHSQPKSTAAKHVAVSTSSAPAPAPSTSSSPAAALASTGTSYPAGKAALIGLAAVLAGLGLLTGGWFMTRTRRSH